MNTRNIDLLPQFESAFTEQKWDKLLTLLNPKSFGTLQSEEVIAFPIVAKTAEILTTKDLHVPNNIKIACLKCLGNTCFNAYTHREYKSIDIQPGMCCHELYSSLVTNNGSLKHIGSLNSYPFHSHFPYEGIIKWTTDLIKSCKIDEDTTDEQIEILRLSIQFLCNLFSFAYKDKSSLDEHNIPKFLCDPTLKDIIRNLTQSEHTPLVRVSCIFIHNALKEFQGQSFTNQEKILLCSQLLKPIKEGFDSAKKALMNLICQADVLKNAYNNLSVEDRLYLLELVYSEIPDALCSSKEELQFTEDIFLFLSERFCKMSDLILKTADSYLDNMEPTEIIILLDILGSVTSASYLKDNRSLLINCTYLLKSIQEIGKASNNYFTPMQKLSDVAQMMQNSKINESEENPTTEKLQKTENKGTEEKRDLDGHPAFGFKAGLIRIIGNMVHRNEKLQDLLREMDVIPLLLDCCNIDARNPLIMQWTIFAVRNLCEANPGNQEIVRNCSRIGVVENNVLQEMGMTLHEDETGRQVGVVPLVRHE
ncbi:ataxin-10 isoform X1 [Megalopta genalis]|uniref:ataxin-10 isoform X1 n=1 Tax=Megalopta genalis TaxID=115081 RepID=UPI003FD192EE